MSWCYRLIVLSAFALVLAGCGVRGDLDPMPDARKKDEPFILDKII